MQQQSVERVAELERLVDELRISIERVSMLAHQHTEASSAATLDVARHYTLAVQDVTLVAARTHAEELSRQLVNELEVGLSGVRRDLRAFEHANRLKVGSRGEPSSPSNDGGRTESASTVDAAFYVALEDRFRGEPSVIAERQAGYLEIVRESVQPGAPVIDLGCGRGEWLGLLRDSDIEAIGVDTNPAFVEEAADAGLTVVDTDLLSYLEAADDASASAITMFQVVEHMDLGVLLQVLAQASRVLRQGGLLIAETPNSLNLSVGASTFWIDPTHVRPLHPDLLTFCALYTGFVRVDGRFLNELDPSYRDIDDLALRRIAERVDGAGDFALLAWA